MVTSKTIKESCLHGFGISLIILTLMQMSVDVRNDDFSYSQTSFKMAWHREGVSAFHPAVLGSILSVTKFFSLTLVRFFDSLLGVKWTEA